MWGLGHSTLRRRHCLFSVELPQRSCRKAVGTPVRVHFSPCPVLFVCGPHSTVHTDGVHVPIPPGRLLPAVSQSVAGARAPRAAIWGRDAALPLRGCSPQSPGCGWVRSPSTLSIVSLLTFAGASLSRPVPPDRESWREQARWLPFLRT